MGLKPGKGMIARLLTQVFFIAFRSRRRFISIIMAFRKAFIVID